MFSFCYHSEIFKIYKCIPPEILLYCIFKFCQLGDGIIVFYPIGNRVSSQPVLLLDVSSVTQLTQSRDPFGGKSVSILVKRAVRLNTNSGLHWENLRDH